jgi:ABC-type transporter MlaC component
MDRVIEATLDIANSESDEHAQKKTHRLIAWAFDVPAMAQYALGDAWARIAANDRRAFRAAFENLLVTKFAREARRHPHATVTFTGARADGERHWLAATQLANPGKPATVWIWRLHRSAQTWRVVDVITEGGSALQRERQEYARILEESGGSLEAVIEFIRRRLATN